MKSILAGSVIPMLSFFVNAQHSESTTIGQKEIIYSNVLNENKKDETP